MGLGCLPAKGDSRNLLIEWPVVLPYLMAMTSLTTAVDFQWLAGASTRLTAAAICIANSGPVNRARSALSPTLKGRLGPKSTVFSAFRLDSVRCKLAFTSSDRRPRAF
jgi:hypothetical protein